MPRRVAFVGLSGPIGYDYRHPTGQVHPGDYSSPNPVLENVSGLLVCYDQLFFFSRHMCPADMRGLPYVHFVEDYPELVARSETAREQFKELIQDDHWDFAGPTPSFDKIIRGMVGKNRVHEFAIDNHTHGFRIKNSEQGWYANSGALDDLILDMGMASSLDMGLVDVVMNSRALAAVKGAGEDLQDAYHYASSAHEAARRLTFRSSNLLTPTGSYHESLEDLRAHRRVEEFRDYLERADHISADGRALAREISHLADANAAEMSRKFLKGRRKFYSVGSVLLGALNFLVPGSGVAATGPLAVAEFFEHRRSARKMAWASFVLDARLARRSLDIS